MIYLVIPYGKYHGWGICGSNLARELYRKTQVRYVADRILPENSQSELEYAFFRTLHVRSPEEFAFLRESNTVYPIVEAFDGDFYLEGFRTPRRVGLSFAALGIPSHMVEKARAYFDVLAAGSEWCRRLLEGMGFSAVTIPQGIDPLLFHPGRSEKRLFRDRFVVFSGGKFELRKGHDVALRAYQVLQDRHDDVMLVAAWYNPFPETMETLTQSPHIRYAPLGTDYHSIMESVLVANAIDTSRVVLVPGVPNVQMPPIYQNTDVGLFPNRCEAGTNLVLMEYMACGKPVIATTKTGHADVLTPTNCVPMTRSTDLRVESEEGELMGVWEQPNIDEAIELLEGAYQNRDRLTAIGAEAGRTLAPFTWEAMAERILRLVNS